MVLGLRTAIYPCTDLAAGKKFYDAVTQTTPYFDEPFYVGYSVGGFELGLIPDGQPGSTGVTAYWGVDDVDAEVSRLIALNAPVLEPVTDVGGGIRVAVLADPFGNRFGLIQNPHFSLAAVR